MIDLLLVGKCPGLPSFKERIIFSKFRWMVGVVYSFFLYKIFIMNKLWICEYAWFPFNLLFFEKHFLSRKKKKDKWVCSNWPTRLKYQVPNNLCTSCLQAWSLFHVKNLLSDFEENHKKWLQITHKGQTCSVIYVFQSNNETIYK